MDKTILSNLIQNVDNPETLSILEKNITDFPKENRKELKQLIAALKNNIEVEANKKRLITMLSDLEKRINEGITRRGFLKGISGFVGLAAVGKAGDVFGRGIKKITIEKLYEIAKPTDEIKNGRVLTGSFKIENRSLSFKKGEWTDYYFDKKYSPLIQEVFFYDKLINLREFDSFMKKYRKNIDEVAMFYNGYMAIDNGNYLMIFPISPETVKKINNL